jgi:hypothetical protein
MQIERQADPKGDRVKIGMTGKFLPFMDYGATGNAQAYAVRGNLFFIHALMPPQGTPPPAMSCIIF